MACDRCSSPCRGRYCKDCEIAIAHEDDIGDQQREIIAGLGEEADDAE